MIERKSTFFLGIFILIVSSSFLGLPSFWRTALLFLSGVMLITLSVKFTLPKKNPKKLRKKDPSITSGQGKISPILSNTIEIPQSPKIEISSVVNNTENSTSQSESLSESKAE